MGTGMEGDLQERKVPELSLRKVGERGKVRGGGVSLWDMHKEPHSASLQSKQQASRALRLLALLAEVEKGGKKGRRGKGEEQVNWKDL